jgi:hypothetical protein
VSRTPQEKLAFEEGVQAGLQTALELAEQSFGSIGGLRAALKHLLIAGDNLLERLRRDAGPTLPRL